MVTKGWDNRQYHKIQFIGGTMVPNKVSAVLDDASVASVMAAIAEIKTKLPFLIDLASDKLKELPRLGGKNLIFTTKALALVKQDNCFMPRDFSVEEMEKDVTLFNNLTLTSQNQRVLLFSVMGQFRFSVKLKIFNN